MISQFPQVIARESLPYGLLIRPRAPFPNDFMPDNEKGNESYSSSDNEGQDVDFEPNT